MFHPSTFLLGGLFLGFLSPFSFPIREDQDMIPHLFVPRDPDLIRVPSHQEPIFCDLHVAEIRSRKYLVVPHLRGVQSYTPAAVLLLSKGGIEMGDVTCSKVAESGLMIGYGFFHDDLSRGICDLFQPGVFGHELTVVLNQMVTHVHEIQPWVLRLLVRLSSTVFRVECEFPFFGFRGVGCLIREWDHPVSDHLRRFIEHEPDRTRHLRELGLLLGGRVDPDLAYWVACRRIFCGRSIDKRILA